MRLATRDRVLVLAPHPDDETLGAGGLLQRARAAGAPLRVVFATDGDNNPWPQRVLERRVRIGGAERARWAVRRRAEAHAALAALGVPPSCAVFLGFPDQALTRLLLADPCAVIEALVAEIRAWSPTLLVAPSLRDRHPDHNALAILIAEALASLPQRACPVLLTYVVHPLRGGAPFADALQLRLTAEERARKLAAIERHATQLVFHRRTYAAFAGDVETFAVASTPPHRTVRRIIEHAHVRDGVLSVTLATPRLRARPASLLVVGCAPARRPTTLLVRLRRWRRPSGVCAGDAGALVATARAARTGGQWTVAVPLPETWHARRMFVKPLLRGRFYDVEGWSRIELARPQDVVASGRRLVAFHEDGAREALGAR